MAKRVACVIVATVAALATSAAAHIALEYPPSRYGPDVLKVGPCGAASGPRSDHVTELEAGAPLEVVWNEYVDHPGHFRIAFDRDGDDGFIDPLCLSGCTTRNPVIQTYSNDTVLLDDIPDTVGGGESRVTITLPDVECDRCTLQVIQVMYDKPPYATPGDDIYYQCADLVLHRALPTCPGDCDGSGEVAIDELVTAIRISLGLTGVDDCRACDQDDDGRVVVNELVRAVAAALGGCRGGT